MPLPRTWGSRKTALQRRWFMALSTSELVTDIFSEPSAEGQSGATPISGPVSSAGTESWLSGVQLVGCDAPRPMRQVSSSYSLLLPCLLLACCILPCHHVHCIIMFSKLASVRFPPVLSVVRSEPRHTCTRLRHLRNIIFISARKNVLGMG